MAEYFGQKKPPRCGVCDNCKRQNNAIKAEDITEMVYQNLPSEKIKLEEAISSYDLNRQFQVRVALKKLIDEGLIQEEQGYLFKRS
jgi:hypothetical protein